MSNFGDYKWVNTRKPHSCAYCGRKIPKSTKARVYKGMFEGDWQNWYACDFCVTYIEPEQPPDEYISGDEFNEWFLDQEYLRCPNCGTHNYKHEWEWSKDETSIAIECCECEHSWGVRIPFVVDKGGEDNEG